MSFEGEANGVCLTQRIKQIKQPRGGYLNSRKLLQVTNLGIVPPRDYKEENIGAGLVGIAVDYLTRFMGGTSVDEAFHISFLGARLVNQLAEASFLAQDIKGLDDASIDAACKLAGYDSAFRAGLMSFRPIENIEPNEASIENIRTMVESGIKFFDEYGPVVHEGITFEGGYPEAVDAGDGDFMTVDALWDFKCSVKPPTNAHTLQVAMYWLLGLHSVHTEDYRKVSHLGFFNPRLGSVYTLDVTDIPKETLHEIEVSVIGYGEDAAIF